MSDDTRKCNSCGTTLPADATECSKCGAKQHDEPSTLSSFELLDDNDLQEMTPEAKPAEEVPPEARDLDAPPSGTPPGRDSLELELEPDAAPEPDSAADEEEDDGIVLEDVAEPEPEAPAAEESAEAEDDDESAQTGETVRMSMHDVVQAWNEEAEAETHVDQATTTLGEAEGLPKGFWPAIIACVVILASALLLLLS